MPGQRFPVRILYNKVDVKIVVRIQNIEQGILNYEVSVPSIFDIPNSTCPLMPFGDKCSTDSKLHCSNKYASFAK
jgi:hypothetical protein